MPTQFEELQARAAKRWDELTAGDSAWIRVGGGTSGQAAHLHRNTNPNLL